MTTLHAQPYDISANGFYFSNASEFMDKLSAATNHDGQPVEEFEIQFIDGEGLDAALFNAVGVHQGNVAAFYEAVEDWNHDEKIRVNIAVSEGGYRFELGKDKPAQFDLDLYACDSLRDLAEQFVEDGLLGSIPANIISYLDYDAIARDLSAGYAETTVDGARYVYRLL